MKNLSASDPLIVQSVEKAFRVLEAFNSARPSMSLTQIAVSTGLDKSAAQRFTHTLHQLGYLHKDPETKRYELSVRTLDLTAHFMRSNTFVNRATPYLLHLSMATEETVNLTALIDTDVIYMARYTSRHVLSVDVVVGTRLPAFCTAPGLAILSRMPDPEVHDVVDRSPIRPYTPHTTCDSEGIWDKILHARKRGFALTVEEYFHGDLSIAAPVLNPGGKVIGAVNIAATTARYTPTEMESKFAKLVAATAHSISNAATAASVT